MDSVSAAAGMQVACSAVTLQARDKDTVAKVTVLASSASPGVHIDPSVPAAKLQKAWRSFSRRRALIRHVRRIQACWRGYSARFHVAEHFQKASRYRRANKKSQARATHRKHVAAIARAREMRFVEQLLLVRIGRPPHYCLLAHSD